MINQPDTHNLLTEARRVLQESLAPQLDGSLRYEALMIGNALGMAVRELEQQQSGEYEKANAALSSFLERQSLSSAPGDEEDTLAKAIRERRLSADDTALQEVLRAITEARLRINNPAYLDKVR